MKVRVSPFAAIWSILRHRKAAFLSARALVALAVLLASPSWSAAQSPYGGSHRSIPGGVQAEDFDHGGQGVGYYDHSWGNNGGQYRSTDVDIAPTNSGGYAVGWIGAGEWLRYSVNVKSAGNYTVTARVASAGGGGTFHIEFNGQGKTGAMRVPNTGGWSNYQDLSASMYLEAGVQEMRVVFDTDGSTGAVGNLSFLNFASGGSGGGGGGSTGSSQASAFGGTARSLPGGVQAEDFDNGGNGTGYNDHTSGNSGGSYRSTDVDIAGTPGGGYAVGWIGAGEWLRYTVNVTSGGQYNVAVRVASAGPGGTFHIEFNGEDKTGAMRVPDTGGWSNYQTINASLWLDAGAQSMRIVFDSNGPWTNAVGNVSFMQFDSGGAAAPAPAPPPTGGGGGGGSGGGRLRVLTWNIHFGHGDPWGQAQLIADSGADVALLQEASTWDEYMPSTYVDKLRQLTGRQWYSVWAPHGGRYTDNEGTLILSRLPLVDKSTMNSNERGFSRAVVSVGGVHVTILNAHLDWDSGMRSAQLEGFLSWGRQFGGPRIAGGDFNSWWGEWWIVRMLQEHTDTWVDVTGSNDNGYTLNGAVRFDYLFRAHDQNWRVNPVSMWVQSTGKSDHAAVIADYDVR